MKPKPKSTVPCPHCSKDLKPHMPKLWGSYCGQQERPKARGKGTRPGIGGRPRILCRICREPLALNSSGICGDCQRPH